MPARIVRPILLLILGLTIAAAAWQIVRLDLDLDVRSAADAATANALAGCRAAMLDLRAVERAYTAPGQDLGFWRNRAATDLEALVACTGTLEATATAGAASPATQVALAKLRAAVTATRGSTPAWPTWPAPASATTPTICSTATPSTPASRSSASWAPPRRPSPAWTSDPRPPSGSGRRPPRSPPAESRCSSPGSWRGCRAPTPRRGRRPTSAWCRPAPSRRTPRIAASAPRLGERAASPAALQAAADVCGALARVEQPLELAGLVERMHGVLDSRGTIVWIYDEGNDALRPGLSAGYASTTIGRMGTIPLSSDTPVATAFTRGEARSVRGTSEAPGALVVPIVTAGGVSGVVTIELPPGNDRQPATLALTRIFAAQLAGLLAVDPRPADVDGPEIVMGAGAARASAATGDARERATGRFADLT